MTDRTITLSRELAQSLRAAVSSNNTSSWSSNLLQRLDAALADPMPPAGGETLPSRPYASEEDQSAKTDYEIGLGHGGLEMWDKFQPHVTRLQAEVERLRERVTPTHKALIGKHAELIRQRDALQAELSELRESMAFRTSLIGRTESELTKARELLEGVVAGTGTSPGANKRYGKIREFLSGQPTADDKRRQIKAERRYERELRNAKVCERFVGYLLDNCEGEVIYEESLQHWMAEMLAKESNQSAPADKE